MTHSTIFHTGSMVWGHTIDYCLKSSGSFFNLLILKRLRDCSNSKKEIEKNEDVVRTAKVNACQWESGDRLKNNEVREHAHCSNGSSHCALPSPKEKLTASSKLSASSSFWPYCTVTVAFLPAQNSPAILLWPDSSARHFCTEPLLTGCCVCVYFCTILHK